MHAVDSHHVVIKNVSHSYKEGTLALSDVNLELDVGLFGLLGANGAGKSTLMRIICTLLQPAAGQVSVGGYDVVTQRNEVRRLLGYLPQEFGAWRLQKVEEVLDTLALLSGMRNKNQRRQRTEEVLSLVGLSEVAKRKVSRLSGGMLRRLGVAQALVHDPKVLIMDEPTIGLDPEERLRFRQLMADLSRDRVILLSTHIVADLGSSCSNLILIHRGRIEFKGSPASLISIAHGHVFELSLTPDAEREFELSQQSESQNFEIVSRVSRSGNSILRCVSKGNASPYGATPAENITLEEAYLAFTINQGRAIG